MLAREESPTGPARVGSVGAVGAAWVASLAFDVFLHAGVLARLYARPSPVLLPADAAFARIPLGWTAFLLLTMALWWLLGRLDVRGARAGLQVGLSGGLVLWGAWILGLYSISPFQGDLLVGWWVGQAAELGLAGSVLGAVRAGAPRRRLFAKVALVVIVLLAATVVLQAAGLAPPMGTVGTR